MSTGANKDMAVLIEELGEARAEAATAEDVAERHLVALILALHVAAAEGPEAALIHVADHLLAVRAPLEPGDPEAFEAAVRRARALEGHAADLLAAASGVTGAAGRLRGRRGRSSWCPDHMPVDERRKGG